MMPHILNMYTCYLFKVFSFYSANSHYDGVVDDGNSDAGEDDEGDDWCWCW